MTKTNLITVITPHYENKTLFRSMQSVLKQNYLNIEYIVICDGQTTYNENDIYKYFNNYKSNKGNLTFKVISQQTNKGTIKALNMAIKESSGEIIFFLADDDIFADEFVISDWVKHFSEIDNIISFAKMARYDVIDSSNCNIFPSHEEIDFFKNSSQDELYDKIAATNFIFGACTAYKKECFEKYGLFDERFRLIEDQSMNLRLIRSGVKIDFFDRVVVNYQNGGCSGITNIGDKYLEDSDNIFILESSKYSKNPNEIMKKYFEWRNNSIKRREEALNKIIQDTDESNKKNSVKMPLFSVAVVIYQQRNILNACLDSIFMQDYNNIELIICDDESCDFDIDEVTKYISEQKHNNISNLIVYKQQQNVGKVANYQKALELSSGIYIKIQQGNDRFENNHVLSEIAEHFERPSAKVIFSRGRCVTHNEELSNNVTPDNWVFDVIEKFDTRKLFESMCTSISAKYVNKHAVFWKRKFLNSLGGFDLRWQHIEDWAMWFKVLLSGIKPVYLNRITILHRYRDTIVDAQPEQFVAMENLRYTEIAEMFKKIALPALKKEYSVASQLRCMQAAMSFEARGARDADWFFSSTGAKILYKIKMLKYFIITGALKVIDGKVNFSIKHIMMIMATFLLLKHFKMPLYNNWPVVKIYSIGIILSGIILVIGIFLKIFLKGISFIIKRR